MPTLTITGENISEPTQYQITAGEQLNPGAQANTSNPDDPYLDEKAASDTAMGWVGPGGTDSWEVQGGLTGLAVDGDASNLRLSIDGQAVDTANVQPIENPAWAPEQDPATGDGGGGSGGGDSTSGDSGPPFTDSEIAALQALASHRDALVGVAEMKNELGTLVDYSGSLVELAEVLKQYRQGGSQ